MSPGDYFSIKHSIFTYIHTRELGHTYAHTRVSAHTRTHERTHAHEHVHTPVSRIHRCRACV